jgi:hypothetical protein
MGAELASTTPSAIGTHCAVGAPFRGGCEYSSRRRTYWKHSRFRQGNRRELPPSAWYGSRSRFVPGPQ